MMKIGFIFGSPKISGGSYVILQHADYLMSKGYSVDLITLSDVKLDKKDIWHPALEKVRFININKAKEQYDLVFATWWLSPFHLHKIESKQYAYFVQSIEAYFFEDIQIPSQILAHSSYTLGLPVITEAEWIKKDLESRFDSTVYLVKNGIRKDIYNLDGEIISKPEKGKLRCLVEGPLTSNFKNVARTIEALKQTEANEIWLLTSTPVDKVPNVDKVFSNVPIAEAAKIFRSCDVIIKQSIVEGMFGPPLEMFHCGGTAIVSNVTGHDEYINDKKNALVTPLNDWKAVKSAVNLLAKDPELLSELKENALLTAKNWPDWETQSELFELSIKEIMKLPAVNRKDLAYKTQHLLNQNELLKNSLNKYYTMNSEQGNHISPSNQGDGESLYFQQLNSTITEPTRLTQAPNSDFIKKDKKNKSDSTRISSSSSPRVLGITISNEHIEELWHPVINKMGWEYQYICSRKKGYFKLYEESITLDIPDDKYIVNTWYSNPELLYKTIEEFKPNVILMHSGNHPAYQQIIHLIKEKYGLPIIYSELGWFPQKQNIYFDALGTNAKSNLAKLGFNEITGTLPKKILKKEFNGKIKNNILLTLQLENDTNFFEFCPHFDSNFEFIEYVIKSIPKDSKLYIKVHPLDHNANIYDVFKEQKNVEFVTDKISDLLPKMSSVIAINSTVLLEALDYPVNIYKCGNSILDNKDIAIEFNDSNLSEKWEDKFVDNTENRIIFKESLIKYQINLTKESLLGLDSSHLSIKVICDAAKQFYLNQYIKNTAEEEKEEIKIPLGHRELPKSLQDIYVAISKYPVITFDVFDTLLVRDLYAPSDLFKYMNRFVCKLLNDPKFDHFHHRVEAEKACRNNISLISGEITLDEIYKAYLLRTGLPANIVNKIKQYEIDSELRFLKARKSAQELFAFAKDTGKKIAILSDFYIGKDFLSKALKENGYDLENVEVLVSCEVNASKKDKSLYTVAANLLDVKPSSILHIGDNFAVDVQNAINSGVNSVHLPNAMTCLSFNNSLKEYFKVNNEDHLGLRSISHSIMLGLILNELYDDPFEHPKNTLFNNSAKVLGLVTLAPLVITFTSWLMKISEEKNIEQLLFLARDGWILKEAYEIMNNSKMPIHYLPASRKLMENMSYHFDFNEINKVLNSRFEGSTLEQLLKLKFNLDAKDISKEDLNKAGFTDLNIPINMPLDKIRVMKLIQQLRGVITKKSEKTYKLFKKYVEENNISSSLKTGIVDIGYFGSMQQILNKALECKTPIDGFYLATRAEIDYLDELSEHSYGFIANKFNHQSAGLPSIVRRLAYMEQLFSAPHNSVADLTVTTFSRKVAPVYYKDTGEKRQQKVLEEIHSGVLVLVREFSNLMKKLDTNIFSTGYGPDYSEFIAKLINSGNKEYYSILKNFILENRYNGKAIMTLPVINSSPTIAKNEPNNQQNQNVGNTIKKA